tara:strand:- start:9010 stop:9432 length:423 start_codon:yes stop_codon:yes gene_type:complete
MKHLFMAVAAAAALAGCATPLDDLLDSRYSEVQAIPAPSGMVGTWTGSTGPYLLALQIKGGGTGLYCYSWNEKHAINRLKYDGEGLVFQDGSTAVIRDVRPDAIVIRSDYTFSKDAILRRDSELEEASPYCMERLREPEK